MTTAPRGSYAPLLDLLRFAAAMLVVVFHLLGNWPVPLLDPHMFLGFPDMTGLSRFTYVGFVGVEIFFVISGFVIAQSAVGRTARDFFVGRTLRIVPVLWLCTAISAAIHYLLGAPIDGIAWAALKNVSLWPPGGWLDGVVWTLGVEAAFYAIVFLALVARPRAIERSLAGIAWGLAVASAGYNLWVFATPTLSGEWLPRMLLLEHGALFALGIGIRGNARGRASLRALVPFALGVSMLEIINQLGSYAVVGGERAAFAPLLIFLAGFCVIVVAASRTSDRLHPGVRMIGLVTYPVYLLHPIVGGAVEYVLVLGGTHVGAAATLATMATVGVSWVIAAIVEPLLRPAARAAIEWLARLPELAMRANRRAVLPPA